MAYPVAVSCIAVAKVEQVAYTLAFVHTNFEQLDD